MLMPDSLPQSLTILCGANDWAVRVDSHGGRDGRMSR